MYRILLAITGGVVPMSLVGQRLAPVPAYATSARSIPLAPDFRRVSDSVVAIPRTYWLEGGIIGAVTTGVLGTLWFRGMSDSRPRFGATVAVGSLCAAAGFAPGALIGGQFRKSRQAHSRSP